MKGNRLLQLVLMTGVLSLLLTSFTDHTHDVLGFAPRSYSSFFDMADEAAISRLYGGIHYRSAIDAGLEQGKCIGQRVVALKFRE
jgi:hypothetical protein